MYVVIIFVVFHEFTEMYLLKITKNFCKLYFDIVILY